MAKGKGLGLALPQQSRPDKGAFDIRSRPLASWVKELPAGNIGETTKQLFQALTDVNRHSHGWKRRFRFLEAIREPLDLVHRSISKRYTGHAFPLPGKTQQIANLSLKLYSEMAFGYLYAIEDMLSSSFIFHDRRALKIMVHRAVRYLNQNLLTSYQVYTQQQAGVWQLLHRLYKFAEAQDFHQDSIKDPLFTELAESSIARSYKQIALLATASPFRLRQGEAVAIYQELARWSAHAKLLKADDRDAEGALFVIHLNSDAEPEYRTFDRRGCDNESCRLLDTQQLVRLMRDEAGYINKAPASVMTQDLYKSLIHDWESAPKRGETRNDGDHAVNTVIGMIQIHQLLAPSLQAQKVTSQRSQFESRTFSESSIQYGTGPKGSADDVWNMYAKNTQKPAKSIPSQPGAQAKTEVVIQRWNVRNESMGGFCLAVPAGQEANVRVGELLAMRGADTLDGWQLGVVRWLRQSTHGELESGVQVLAPQMIPVMVKNLTPGKEKSEYQRGLLLPAVQDQGQSATLITPNRIFSPAEKVLLHVLDNESVIILDNAIQDSGTFVQFDFHSGETANAEPPLPPASPVGSSGSPFEKLWGQL